MIYTSYISNIRNLPEGKYVLVTRWAPKSLDLSKFDDAQWQPSLAPEDILLAQYKNGAMTKNEMFDRYKEYLNNNISVKLLIHELAEEALHKDVFLICYEKETFDCHRSILAQYIAKEYNLSWKEY